MRTALTNVNVLTGRLDADGKMEMKNGTVLIDDGKFIAVCPENADLDGCKVRDLGGKYMMPGLINMHVHIASAGKPSKPREKPVDYKRIFDILTKFPLILNAYRKMNASNARTMFLSGATTIRTVGGILAFDGKIRDDILSGRAIGPRMLVANTAVSVPGGHFAGSLATEATSPEEARADVRRIAETNPDLIKIMVTGGILDAPDENSPITLRMPPEIVEAACDEAHKLGYKVAAHVESNEGVKVALRGGVDTIEHGGKPDEEMMDLFKKTGASLILTLSPALPGAYMGVGNELCQKLSLKLFKDLIDCAKMCMENGITVGFGTDTGCPYTTPNNTWRELPYLVKYLGISPDKALNMATEVNSKILGRDDEFGTIEEGKSADFVVTDTNPLDDFTVLKNIYMVSVMGRIVTNPKPAKFKTVDETMDKILTGDYN